MLKVYFIILFEKRYNLHDIIVEYCIDRTKNEGFYFEWITDDTINYLAIICIMTFAVISVASASLLCGIYKV